MQARPPVSVAPAPPPGRRPIPRLRLLAILGGVFVLCCGGLLTFGAFYSQTPQYQAGQTATAGAALTVAARPTATPLPSSTLVPSATLAPSATAKPSNTPPATATGVSATVTLPPTTKPTQPPTAVAQPAATTNPTTRPTAKPAAQPTAKPTTRPTGCTPIYPVGSHHTCGDFKTHAQAQCFFEASGGKTGTAASLDGNDKDGLACETLP